MFDNQLNSNTDRAKNTIPRDPHLFKHLPYLLEVDDEIIRTRENALISAFQVYGVNGSTSSDQDINILSENWSNILNGLDERYTFYVHRLLKPIDITCAHMPGDGFASDVEKAWQKEIAAREPREFMIVVSVVRNVHAQIKVPFFGKKMQRTLFDDTRRRVDELRQLVSTLESALNVKAKRLKISDGSLLGFLGAINTGHYAPRMRGEFSLIAEDVANISPRFVGNSIVFEDGLTRQKFGAVLILEKYSANTIPGMMDILDALDGVLVSHSFTPVENRKIIDRAAVRVAQMTNAQDMAETIKKQLWETVDQIESGVTGCGDHQMSVTIFADAMDELDEIAARIIGAAHQAGITLFREQVALQASYFASHPGNQAYLCRQSTVTTKTFADLASFHLSGTGASSDNLPWRTPVAILTTDTGTAHRFSFHPPGDPDAEPTNGHTLVLGPSDGGKTTSSLFLATMAQRTRGRLIVLDKGQATRMALTALGGQYADIEIGKDTGLNPLLTENGPRGEAWLMGWLSSLLESTGDQLTPRQSEELRNAIRQVLNTENDGLRNFESFLDLIGNVDDENNLAMRVAEWGPRGRYSWVFGEAENPVVDFRKNRITGIDLSEILDLKTERTAILGYLIRTLETLFAEKVPTVLMIDEAWQVLNDEYFAQTLSKWLVTARKQQVVVMMMTQFPSQIRESHAKTILEALPNKLIFPNQSAVASDYDGYGLSDNELAFILGGQTAGKREVLYRTEKQGSTILDINLKSLGASLTVLGGGDAGERAFGADYASHPHFWR